MSMQQQQQEYLSSNAHHTQVTMATTSPLDTTPTSTQGPSYQPSPAHTITTITPTQAATLIQQGIDILAATTWNPEEGHERALEIKRAFRMIAESHDGMLEQLIYCTNRLHAAEIENARLRQEMVCYRENEDRHQQQVARLRVRFEEVVVEIRSKTEELERRLSDEEEGEEARQARSIES